MAASRPLCASVPPAPADLDEADAACAHAPIGRKGRIITRIDDLMERVDSKFHLVHLSAKRAREINAYFAHLGEGIGQYVPPLVSAESDKPLSIALEEIATGKVEAAEPTEIEVVDPLGFIEDDDAADEPDNA